MQKLKCPGCGSPLALTVAFSGCDWETMAGKGSGYDYPIHLDCTDESCAYVWTLGYLNDAYSFSPVVRERQPYTEAKGFVVNYPSKREAGK